MPIEPHRPTSQFFKYRIFPTNHCRPRYYNTPFRPNLNIIIFPTQRPFNFENPAARASPMSSCSKKTAQVDFARAKERGDMGRNGHVPTGLLSALAEKPSQTRPSLSRALSRTKSIGAVSTPYSQCIISKIIRKRHQNHYIR